MSKRSRTALPVAATVRAAVVVSTLAFAAQAAPLPPTEGALSATDVAALFFADGTGFVAVQDQILSVGAGFDALGPDPNLTLGIEWALDDVGGTVAAEFELAGDLILRSTSDGARLLANGISFDFSRILVEDGGPPSAIPARLSVTVDFVDDWGAEPFALFQSGQAYRTDVSFVAAAPVPVPLAPAAAHVALGLVVLGGLRAARVRRSPAPGSPARP